MWPREDIDCLVENIVKNLHNNQTLSDLIIRLKDGTLLYGHRFVLASRSKLWYNQFINSAHHTPPSPTTPSTTTNLTAESTNNVTSSCSSSSTTNPTTLTSTAATSSAQNTNTNVIATPIVELDWSDLDPEIATIILAWIYNGELELNENRIRDEKFIYSMMKVAKKFKLAQMINQCEKTLQNQAAAQPSSTQSTPQSQDQNQQQQQQPQQQQQNAPTTKQHSQHSFSHLPATTRMKLSHLRAQIKRQASKAARSRLEKRSSVSGETSASTSTKHHLVPGGHNQDSLHQKNFKQKLIALIKKFRTDDSDFEIEEQYREALERELMEAAAGRGSRAIEELLEEDIEVEEESGSEAEDWDNISETSTPKPSLRPFFSSTTLDKI